MTARTAALSFAILLSMQPAAAPSIAAVAAVDSVTTYATIVAGVQGVAFDSGGNLYASGQLAGDAGIWKVGPGGSPVTPLVMGMSNPKGLAVDATGNLFVADWGNNSTIPAKIWKVTPGGVKSVFASVTGPTDIVLDLSGNLLVSEQPNRVQLVTPAGVVSNYATGLGVPTDQLGGLSYDSATGDLYIETETAIRKIGAGGSPVTVIASGLVAGVGLARGSAGEFYVSRYSHKDLYYVTPGGVASLYAGAHLSNGCTNGPLLTARFSLPAFMRVYNDTLYIADSGCGMVRAINLPGVTPAISTTWGRLKTMYR